jgi:methyltransferase (TIGR00027 family)
VIENVSDTAFWIAHYRALESRRADALFHDPLAGVLAGDRGKTIAAAMPRAFITSWSVVIRTCIIDDFLRSAIGEGVDTVLNLGAGLDTRPYRMDLPEGIAWVEADYPHVIELKETRLSNEKPRCRLERVSLDLANLAERRNLLAGVDGRARKLLVLTEGVVPYLSLEEAGSLADDLRRLDHACCWIVDYFAPEMLKYRERHGIARKMQNAPFKFAPKDWFGFFGGHGWQCREIRYLAEEADRLQRPVQLPLIVRVMMKAQGLFASRERRAAFRKFAGYVLLEPAPNPPGNPA